MEQKTKLMRNAASLPPIELEHLKQNADPDAARKLYAEASLRDNLRRVSKMSKLHPIVELRVLAEQVAKSTKHSKLDETFTLTSNKVPMHRTDEVKTFKK